MTRDAIAVLVAAPLLALPAAEAIALDLHCKIGERRGVLFGSLGPDDYPDIDPRAYVAEETDFYFDIDVDNNVDRNHPKADVQVKTASIVISDWSVNAYNRYGVFYQYNWVIDRISGEFQLSRLVHRDANGWPFIHWLGQCRVGRPATRF